MVLEIKRVLSLVRKAVQDYNMIEDGDRIAVGVSGGKDSLALLMALRGLQKFYPKKFELEAVTLKMGIGEVDLASVEDICKDIGVRYTIENTFIGKIVFEIKQEKNPCSLCANLRRGALNNVAQRLNCNKIALGHNKDDVIETFLLSLFYEGRIHTFSPMTYLERKNLHIIRPLIYLEEKKIKELISSSGIRLVASPCHMDGKTKRQYIKEMISEMSKDKHDLKNSIMGAIKRAKIDSWY